MELQNAFSNYSLQICYFTWTRSTFHSWPLLQIFPKFTTIGVGLWWRKWTKRRIGIIILLFIFIIFLKVGERISDVFVKHFGANYSRFTPSGREDVDVRMLGTGRPFVVQLLNARRTACLNDKQSTNTLAWFKKYFLEKLQFWLYSAKF